MLVREAMTPDPVTVVAQETARSAALLLAEHAVTALPVVDTAGAVTGVVSEADLLPGAFVADPRTHLRRHAASAGVSGSEPTVAQVMTSPAVTVHGADDVVGVVALMGRLGHKSLPVVDDGGRLVGVISRSDLLRSRARSDAVVADEVRGLLVDLERPRWTVEVSRGSVDITGPATSTEHALAEACAESVVGVVRVTTHPR